MMPKKIALYTQENRLKLQYANAKQVIESYDLSGEYLRVYTPSSENRIGTRNLISGKKKVQLLTIQKVGHYALKLLFDDRHESGLYTFDYLYELSRYHAEYWQHYLNRLEAAGLMRDPVQSLIRIIS